VFCFFESGYGHFTRDGRKSLQKAFECFSALQVVEHRLDGHSGSAKHRSSGKNVRVFDDYSHEMIVSRAIGAGAGTNSGRRYRDERFIAQNTRDGAVVLSAQADASSRKTVRDASTGSG